MKSCEQKEDDSDKRLRKRLTRTVKKARNFKCRNKCCDVSISPFKWTEEWMSERKRTAKKAGIFIYDSSSRKMLLIQSCGYLWGPPKGGVYKGESIMKAAIREVYEETGLKIDEKMLIEKEPSFFKKKAYYYVLDIKESPVKVQDVGNNDANGITWINIDCIDCLRTKRGEYTLTKHCKLLIAEIFGVKLNNKHNSCPLICDIPQEIKDVIIEENN